MNGGESICIKEPDSIVAMRHNATNDKANALWKKDVDNITERYYSNETPRRKSK